MNGRSDFTTAVGTVKTAALFGLLIGCHVVTAHADDATVVYLILVAGRHRILRITAQWRQLRERAIVGRYHDATTWLLLVGVVIVGEMARSHEHLAALVISAIVTGIAEAERA